MTQIKNHYEAFPTLYWSLFYTVILGLVVNMFTILILTIFSGSEVQETGIKNIADSPQNFFFVSILQLALTSALIKQGLHSTSFAHSLSQAGLSKIKMCTLFQVLLIGIVFSVIESGFFDYFDIPEPEFTEILTDNLSSSVAAAFFTISAVCMIGPVFEEIVFRGILYKRIVQSNVGPLGAIILPNIIFSLVHQQYSEPLIFTFIFISGCLLSWIRHITGNLWYCIALHCFWNSLVIIDIAYFE